VRGAQAEIFFAENRVLDLCMCIHILVPIISAEVLALTNAGTCETQESLEWFASFFSNTDGSLHGMQESLI